MIKKICYIVSAVVEHFTKKNCYLIRRDCATMLHELFTVIDDGVAVVLTSMIMAPSVL